MQPYMTPRVSTSDMATRRVRGRDGRIGKKIEDQAARQAPPRRSDKDAGIQKEKHMRHASWRRRRWRRAFAKEAVDEAAGLGPAADARRLQSDGRCGTGKGEGGRGHLRAMAAR